MTRHRPLALTESGNGFAVGAVSGPCCARAERESMVLLKNERSLLPFRKSDIKFIAIIGSDAYPAVGGGSARQAFAFARKSSG